MIMVFNDTFNNISVISWLSVLLVEETGISEENPDLSQVTDKFYHIECISSHGRTTMEAGLYQQHDNRG
jgi:hypothetical protein